MKRYILKYSESQEHSSWSMAEMLEMINEDRSEEFTPYDETDWLDGLSMTFYTFVAEYEITRDEIMDFFRYEPEDDALHTLSADDKAEIALACVAGNDNVYTILERAIALWEGE